MKILPPILPKFVFWKLKYFLSAEKMVLLVHACVWSVMFLAVYAASDENQDFEWSGGDHSLPQSYSDPWVQSQTEQTINYDNSQYSYEPNYYGKPSEHSTKPKTTPNSQQQISEKFWNVPAPYIPPNKNLLEDVSFNVGIILTIFIAAVFTLGFTAGVLSKPNTGRSFIHLDSINHQIENAIQKFENIYKN